MLAVIGIIIILGIVVFVHEFGHFLFAKIFNVGVETFSIGFGKKILKKEYKGTEYALSLIPLGGYVKLKGEHIENDKDDSEEGEKKREIPGDELGDKKPYEKIMIFMAGAVFNIILAFIIYSFVFFIGINTPIYNNIIGRVQETSPAYDAGLINNDIILEVNGDAVDTFDKILTQIIGAVGSVVDLKVMRDGELMNLQIKTPHNLEKYANAIGILPFISPQIGTVSDEIRPALESGLEKGDYIISINSKTVKSWYEVSETIRENEGNKLTISYLRNGNIYETSAVPEYNERLEIYMVGIGPYSESKIVSFSFPENFAKGASETIKIARLTLVGLYKIITGNISIRSMGSPILISAMASVAIREGLIQFLFLVGFVSVSLGVINLFPFPVVDGGLIVITVVEWISRKKIPEKVLGFINQFGVAFLLTLALISITNDISRFGWDQAFVEFFKGLF